jgi:hypothetical protein
MERCDAELRSADRGLPCPGPVHSPEMEPAAMASPLTATLPALDPLRRLAAGDAAIPGMGGPVP